MLVSSAPIRLRGVICHAAFSHAQTNFPGQINSLLNGNFLPLCSLKWWDSQAKKPRNDIAGYGVPPSSKTLNKFEYGAPVGSAINIAHFCNCRSPRIKPDQESTKRSRLE
jgi:hypothetical protein